MNNADNFSIGQREIAHAGRWHYHIWQAAHLPFRARQSAINVGKLGTVKRDCEIAATNCMVEVGLLKLIGFMGLRRSTHLARFGHLLRLELRLDRRREVFFYHSTFQHFLD